MASDNGARAVNGERLEEERERRDDMEYLAGSESETRSVSQRASGVSSLPLNDAPDLDALVVGKGYSITFLSDRQ